MPRDVAPVRVQLPKLAVVVQWTAFLIAPCVAALLDFARFGEQVAADPEADRWFFLSIDTKFYLVLLAIAPLVWCGRRALFRRTKWSAAVGRLFGGHSKPAAQSRGWAGWPAWCLAMLVGLTSLTLSASISATTVQESTSTKFGDLPPAYHDEFSYLFQAKTFLAGRLWFPSHPTAPELFDQMHVLNEGRFASRYFPGAGAWMAPFLALGKPYWGHWLAGALCAIFIFWTGRELGGNGVGFLAGMLTALSPGMGLFSNLLLAHHPTLAGLALFCFTFLRMLRTRSRTDAVLAGLGLSFAMLSRPMTAAGFALPFGLWFLWWLWKENAAKQDGIQSPLKWVAALGTPLFLGLVILFVTNRAITGSGWKTPYQVYTATYTPRHGYGFDNRVRGEQQLGPKVLENYDKWAENLTPALAVRNVRDRLASSWTWTLGMIPLAVAAIVFVLRVPQTDRRWWLIPAAIVSLHAVHVPYWFVGIMNWHYVFESGPLWLLMFSGATQILVSDWRAGNRPWMPIWWSGVVLAALLTTHTSLEPFWRSRMEAGLHEVAFSRLTYHNFYKMIDRLATAPRALVLIEPDPHDRHIDFVVNEPGLQADILFGRRRPETNLSEIVRLFPNRTCYLYRVKQRQLTRITPDR